MAKRRKVKDLGVKIDNINTEDDAIAWLKYHGNQIGSFEDSLKYSYTAREIKKKFNMTDDEVFYNATGKWPHEV